MNIRFQSQNLNDLPGSTPRNRVQGPMWQHGRCWLYVGRYTLRCCWSFDWWITAGASVERGDGDDRWSLCLTLPPLFLSVGIGGPWRMCKRRAISLKLAFPELTLGWVLWKDDHEWNSRTPRWRQGHFDIVDFLLGRWEYSERDIETREIAVPMPERVYRGKARLFVSTWKRPRWFAKQLVRVGIDLDKGEGIPCQGKGENSWDCGTNHTYGITCAARSIPEGVGVLVGSVLRDRVKYGGWRDWMWARPHEAS